MSDVNLDEVEVLDQAEEDNSVVPQEYTVSSFGADYDVRGLVSRLDEKKIFIPDFQRNYVWKQAEASRFIESLLLGLPVPGIFLAKESEENKLLVIDGQQRLRTLLFFYSGFFNPSEEKDQKKVFKLKDVQPQFEGKTYKDLLEKDKNRLDDSIIHATVVKQESPADGDTSLYHIFERLNNGGINLNPQEIRVALYHGPFINLIGELNKYGSWRAIYGKESNRLKDQELILRFLALYFNSQNYKKPLGEFLNRFASLKRNEEGEFLETCKKVFISTIDSIHKAIGNSAFRPETVLSAAMLDSVMVGVSRRLETGSVEEANLKSAYNLLVANPDYLESISKATSDEANVTRRIAIATEVFSKI